MKDTFDEKMTASKPAQSASAREAMFVRIMEQVSGSVPATTSIVSPYTAWLHKPSKALVAGVLGVFLVVGTGSTVAAAESAKPGDVLFPVDQATEAMRLLLASQDRKTELKSAFLDERQQELVAIVAEEIEKTKKEITDITNGVQVNEQGEARITRAVDVFLRQAEELPKSDTEGRRRAVITLIDEVRVQGRVGDDVRLRIDNDRFEIRTDDMRIRGREDDELEVRSEEEGEEDDQDRSGHGSSDDRDFDTSDNRRVESEDSHSDNQEEDDSHDTNDRAEDRHNRGGDTDNRLEEHSGKDDSKDEDKDEDKTDDHSGKSDND